MTPTVTVLGSAGSHTGVGRVCSGYLLRSGRTAVLLDAGNGATANLQRFLPLRDLDAIIVSHRHIDHCVDLVGGFYALKFDPEAQGRRVPLYAAAEVYETLTGMLSSDSAMSFGEYFDHRVVGHGDELQIGGLTITFARSIHPPPTVSTRIEAGGKVLVYSADSAGGDDLVAIARDADLFLCEATWAGDASQWPSGIHLTATEAGAVARAAGVKRLVLTHIAGGTDRDRVLREAGQSFDGPIELADDLQTYTID